MLRLLPVVHLAATASMMGLIWFIQLVHYPLFTLVGEQRFVAYEQQHTRRTSWVVGPLMGVETLSALILVVAPGDVTGRFLPLVGLGLLGVIHASTIFVQVPLHGRLSTAYEQTVARRLVTSNWIRTAGWTARMLVAAAIAVTVLA